MPDVRSFWGLINLIKNRKPILFAVPVVLAQLFLSGCEDGGSKRAKTAPPPAAQAPTLTVQKPEPPKPAPIAVPPVETVESVIQRAEREFHVGQAEYQAGHMTAAKMSFDRAVGILMQGPVDVRSDERLQTEFDKIIDNVNQLEMVALKEGDGFTEQKAEVAPIDEANAITFPVDPALKAEAERELTQTHSDLPLVINDYVAGYINFFTTRGRGTLTRAWQRAGRYQDMIRRVFKEEGVPQDLLYLAQAESGFMPVAVSKVGARGMWQFMHYTAPTYGLHRSWWVDERQDPEKATRAAALYLKDLYNQFGDWYLAMAAYNTGAGNVQRGVQRTGYADFWELYKRNVLPEQTKNYVPIIVAMTIIAKNPAQYGLTDVQVDPPLQPDVVKVDYAVDLRLVAEAVDYPVDVLADLNPSLLRLVTPRDQEFDLNLPAGSRENFQLAIAAIPKDKRVLWRYHRVAANDSLGSIARKYHTNADAISKVNNLQGEDLPPDTKLIIPVTTSRAVAEGAGSYSKHPSRYTVRKGDTVLSVADDFAVPAEKVRKWNHLQGNTLRAGRKLVIYKPLASGQTEPAGASKKGKSRKKTTGQAKK